jgi:hypothetical protein
MEMTGSAMNIDVHTHKMVTPSMQEVELGYSAGGVRVFALLALLFNYIYWLSICSL